MAAKIVEFGINIIQNSLKTSKICAKIKLHCSITKKVAAKYYKSI